jgi:hypothetical protein
MITGMSIVAVERDWKHTGFSSTHFLRFLGFQPSADSLPMSGHPGGLEVVHSYTHSAREL